ncbi:hypothetical protein OVA29_02875 [Exiguobacterium sp. SL14]|nr:hypothetical protein [Exiguobacterium sp. SL14]MCY1689882.1 hypothetical protein [Exiguobacterium sp. SL14]
MNTTFMKITVATIIAGSTLFSGTASAATKVETASNESIHSTKSGYDDGTSRKSLIRQRL